MSSFDKSLSAFTSAVSAETSTSAAALKVTPASEKVIGHNDVLVPGFVPFLALVPGKSGVAGWSNDKGTVVLLRRQNIGSILDAMGMANASSTFSALELARRVAWAHVGYRFVAEPSDFGDVATPPGGGPPELTRDADGGATLTFFMVEVGDTGFQAAVKCVVRRDAQGSYSYALARA